MSQPFEDGGSPSTWVIVQYTYSSPLAIIVSTNYQNANIVVSPYIQTLYKHVDLHNYNTICGANNYFSENNTIHFVITAAPTCIVRVK
jgi:hypothetical protein